MNSSLENAIRLQVSVPNCLALRVVDISSQATSSQASFLLTLPVVHSVDAITFNEIHMVMSRDLCSKKLQ